MKPKVLILENPDEIAKYAAEILEKEIKKKPSLVLGLPTGKTVVPLYAKLVKKDGDGAINFSKVKTFNLDEYLGLNQESKASFHRFMDKNFFEKTKIQEKNVNFLNGATLNVGKECERYEEEIKKAGGLDLTILGIGVNGHIAFNEPGSDFASRTREIILHYQTRKSNFGLMRFIKTPTRALTMGIATILGSKKIILIATGKHKANAIKCMLDKPDTKCPASALQNHKDVLVLLDKEAAKLIKKD